MRVIRNVFRDSAAKRTEAPFELLLRLVKQTIGICLYGMEKVPTQIAEFNEIGAEKGLRRGNYGI